MNDIKVQQEDQPIIEIRGLGKKYDIVHSRGGYIALRDVLMNVLKNPFAFARDKVKTAVGMSSREEFWALRNINLNIKRGEVIGVIGSNGAGKSTLLKILTGITPPTEGEAILRGRVSSLLEVGTGFHPELTGRENIFLNGAILGMRKKEINEKFDEIVAFAGIEKFLDTPVKRYSSGMYVRLAFSVAAHMEPDILLVDEVLAVGDAEFQKKCLGKMEEVTNKSGRTILFVSHNMDAIRQLCDRSILLEEGEIAFDGKTSQVIDRYMRSKGAGTDFRPSKIISSNTGEIEIIESWIENSKKEKVNKVISGEKIKFSIKYRSKVKGKKSLKFSFALTNLTTHDQLSDLLSDEAFSNIDTPEEGVVTCLIPKLPLNVGMYSFNICIRVNGFVAILIKEAIVFEVLFGDFFGTGRLPDRNQGNILMEHNWSIK